MMRILRLIALSGFLLLLGTVACQPSETATPAESPSPLAFQVTLVSPDDLKRVKTYDSLVLQFNQPMDPDSSERPFSISPYEPGAFNWTDNNQKLSFQPLRGFRGDRSYSLELDADLRTAAGKRPDYVGPWEFTTLEQPNVRRGVPEVQESGQYVRYRLDFTLPMDEDSVLQALSIFPERSLNTFWEEDTLFIENLDPVFPDISYEFTLSSDAMSLEGASLEKAMNWTYQPPALLGSSHFPDRSHPGGDLVLRFNYPLNWDLLKRSFRIYPSAEGLLDIDQANSSLIFSPSPYLPFNTDYEVSFSQPLEDPDGNVLGELDPLTFKTPPPILLVQPGEYDLVETDRSIQIEFALEMDPSSTEAAVQIAPEIEGVFNWNGTVLFFTPSSGALAGSTAYQVSISTDALDVAGNPVLSAPHRWSFETAVQPPIASFVTWFATNVHHTYPQSNLSIDYEFSGSSADELTFELYQLTYEQFGGRYAFYFDPHPTLPTTKIPIGEAELIKTWKSPTSFCGESYGCWRETTVPGRVDRGLYLLNVRKDEIQDQIFLAVTDMLLTVKASGGQVLAWLTNRNGDPISDAHIYTYIANGQLGHEGTTDENGLYRTWIFGRDQPTVVVARVGDNLTTAGIDSSWRTMVPYGCGGWWGSWWWSAHSRGESHGSERILAHIHTDRPIYRPGHTVYFKSIIRRDQDALIGLPQTAAPVTVRVLDPRGNVLQTTEHATNSFGTIHGSFNLADGASLGDYALEVSMNDDTFRQIFKVEEYQKPDYQVIVMTDADHYLVDDKIQVTVDASYFMGQPVANAQVTVRRFSMSPSYYWWNPPAELIDFEAREKGFTDEQGRIVFEIDAPSYYTARPVSWYSSLTITDLGIEVTVDDGSSQVVNGFVTVPVYSASESLQVSTGGYFHPLGTTLPVRIEVKTVEGLPVPDRELEWSIQRYQSTTYQTTLIESSSVRTNEEGVAEFTYQITRSGWYEVEVVGEDEGGREISSSRWFYVRGTEGHRFSRGVFEVYADKTAYQPGDTAKLVIESNFGGPALLTMERASVRRTLPITLTPPTTIVEIPIQTDDVPNIYAVVTTWAPFEDLEYFYGPTEYFHKFSRVTSVELSVPAVGKQLKIEIAPDQEIYAPGEQAIVSIHVEDSAGIPVSAELSLALVDESIFSLSEELSASLFDTFYGPRDHMVNTYDTLSVMRHLYIDGCGGGGGGGPLAGKPRSDFPDTAIWIPQVITDANGDAEVVIDLPDTLTSWRLTARAVTKDHKVGEQTRNFLTQRPLVIRPVLPRTLVEGDLATLSASVHNFTEESLSLEIVLESPSLLIDGSPKQNINLAGGETQIVAWQVLASSAGDATITMTARGQGISDAVQLPLPIRTLAIRDVQVFSGETEAAHQLTLNLLEDLLQSTTLSLSLSRSVAEGLLTGMEYLTGFPYGCVEQTMSAALPNAVISRAFHRLGVLPAGFEGELTAKIHLGLGKLYSLQHDDGGWGWWWDDASLDYQTAWVLYGLAITQEAGHEVDPEVIQRAADWLTDNLSKMDLRTRAFALYSLALAGYGEPDYALGLLNYSVQLDPFSKAALALALDQLGYTAEAKEITSLLLEEGRVQDEGMYWPVPNSDGYYYRKTMASSIRSTALVLSALLQIEGEDEDTIDAIARWLMSRRSVKGWGTTNETAFTIVALTDYLVASEAESGPTGYQLSLNGEELASGTLTTETYSLSLEIPADILLPGDNQVQITSTDGTRLYYTLIQETVLSRTEVEAGGGIFVSRTFQDAVTHEDLDRFNVGQLVLVKLEITLPEDRAYMIIEDPLPGGLVGLNERLNNSSHITEVDPEIGEVRPAFFFWESYGYNYKEVRDDQVTFFITTMDEGTYTYSYYARATHPGTFAAPPTEVYAMYDLSSWGRSASHLLIISDDLTGETALEEEPPYLTAGD